MANKPGAGRPTVYQGVEKRYRYQGNTTKVGAIAFERARSLLMELTGLTRVSDGAVMEFLARGGTVAAREVYLQSKAEKKR